MAKKINAPTWAPSNIGQILRDMRKVCGIKGLYSSLEGTLFIGELIISPQILQQIESGKRAADIEDIKDIIGALIHYTGNKLKEAIEIGSLTNVPEELKNLIYDMYSSCEKSGKDPQTHILIYRNRTNPLDLILLK